MTKMEALRLIDDHKNKLIDPVEMLKWAWLRVIIYKMPEEDWEMALLSATEELAR